MATRPPSQDNEAVYDAIAVFGRPRFFCSLFSVQMCLAVQLDTRRDSHREAVRRYSVTGTDMSIVDDANKLRFVNVLC